jgi:SAM-dependent methyltransferase
VTARITQQYEKFPYPSPNQKWDELIEFGEPRFYSSLLWPEGKPCDELNILIAGCGTVQAARYALHHPDCRVLGVDLSTSAISEEQRLKEQHGLTNLELKKLDLRDIGKLNRAFDLIVSTGVLHHLSQPEDGLKALASVLDHHGAMSIMLYGSASRSGVYLLQDAFKRLGLGADHSGLELARSVIGNLPQHHYFNWYRSNAPDLATDSGIVDTLLHSQDRGYSVPQVLQLVADCGLVFQSWEDNHYYFPEGNIRSDSLLWQKLKAIPERDQWAVVENITLATGRHTFIGCRPERGYRDIAFGRSDFLEYIPMQVPGFTVVQRGEIDPPRAARCRRGRFEFALSYAEVILFSNCDGKRTVAEILRHPTLTSHPAATREEFGRSFFERMWKLGHLWMLTSPQA